MNLNPKVFQRGKNLGETTPPRNYSFWALKETLSEFKPKEKGGVYKTSSWKKSGRFQQPIKNPKPPLRFLGGKKPPQRGFSQRGPLSQKILRGILWLIGAPTKKPRRGLFLGGRKLTQGGVTSSKKHALFVGGGREKIISTHSLSALCVREKRFLSPPQSLQKISLGNFSGGKIVWVGSPSHHTQ